MAIKLLMKLSLLCYYYENEVLMNEMDACYGNVKSVYVTNR